MRKVLLTLQTAAFCALCATAACAQNPVVNGGFEAVQLAPGHVVRKNQKPYDALPAGTSYTFNNLAGIASIPSDAKSASNEVFGSGQAAAEGRQVGFVQGASGSFVAQDVAFVAAGRYALSFQAARSTAFGGDAQEIQVTVTGDPGVFALNQTFMVSKTTFTAFASHPFTVSAGTHTLRFLANGVVSPAQISLLDALSIKPVTAKTASAKTASAKEEPAPQHVTRP